MVCHKLGKSFKEIHDDLILANSDDAPSLMTVWRWVDRFKCGVEKLKDQHRPKSIITEKKPVNIPRDRGAIGNVPWSN